MHPLCQSAQKQTCLCFFVVQNNDENEHENKKIQQSAMVALLLLHLTGFDADHPHWKLINQIKVTHWLTETLELIRSQARLLIGTIGTG